MARYLANTNKLEIHDLQNQQINCQINEIKQEHRISLNTEDDVKRWINLHGFNGCKWCLSKYHTG